MTIRNINYEGFCRLVSFLREYQQNTYQITFYYSHGNLCMMSGWFCEIRALVKKVRKKWWLWGRLVEVHSLELLGDFRIPSIVEAGYSDVPYLSVKKIDRGISEKAVDPSTLEELSSWILEKFFKPDRKKFRYETNTTRF